ncbi:MAG: hypothetical protein AAGF99_00395 [Bacteroidota bacterium]
MSKNKRRGRNIDAPPAPPAPKLRYVDFAECVLEPVGAQVRVELIDEPPTSAGGLVRPDGVREQPFCGLVEACGPDVKRANVGDVVMIGQGNVQGFLTVDGMRALIHNDGIVALVTAPGGAPPLVHDAPEESRIIQPTLAAPTGLA